MSRKYAAAVLIAWFWAISSFASTTRVATLLPFVADALDRMPGEVEVVASVPSELGQTLPPGRIDLGNSHSPSFEMLAAAQADLIVGNRTVHATLIEKLQRAAPEVVMIEATSVEATFEGLQQVGAAAGVAEQMEDLIVSTRRSIAELEVDDRISLLPLFGAPGAYMAITERTWLGDLIDEIGFDNLAAGLSGQETYPGYVELSEEVLATLEPDLVVLVTHGSPDAIAEGFSREAQKGGVWASLADKIEILDPALFARNPGLDMAAAGQTLVGLAQSTASR